jgi:Flp pilus assembly protein TadD
MELGKFSESRLMLNKALAMEPENIKIISNLGILSLKEGKKKSPLDSSKPYLKSNPQTR